MSDVLQSAALLVTVLGVISAALVLAASRDARTSLRVLLEFLVAAGLLRLSDDPSWRALLTAAVVITVRKLASYGLSRR